MRKNVALYAAIMVVFGVGIYLILQFGNQLNHRPITDRSATEQSNEILFPSINIGKYLSRNFAEQLSILLLQLVIILLVARLMGNFFRKMGQPAVIGEIAAGIFLGPSLLGLVAPGVQSFIFPEASLAFLKLLSQIGVILFMFVVGMEVDAQHLRKKAETAVLVSHASIIFPFFLGLVLSLFTYRSLAPNQISFVAFSLFMGIAMSITAFPVLARIIKERGLSGTYLGTIAIACAAVDDVTAWCILALVVAIARTGGIADSILTICLTFLFFCAMFFAVRPGIRKALAAGKRNDIWGNNVLAFVLVFVFVSALSTELIGIHALFGAFLAGVSIPRLQGLRLFLTERLDTFASVLLLPLFFAFSGLRTRLDLLNDWQSWLLCLAIIAVAIVGKLGGSSLIGRWTGMSWRDALSLGALMNTRGLIELIVLNVGYDMGIVSREMFAMMILMALTTTLMAGPLLSLFEKRKRPEATKLEHLET